MKRLFGWALALASLAAAASAAPSSEIVVSIRYLQPKGVSHAHLYLYREDGRLLRQLTSDNAGQDREPRFAPDGETIVFQREIPKRPVEYWSVEPRGGELRRLRKPPAWYDVKGRSSWFTIDKPLHPGAEWKKTSFGDTIRTPDGRYEVVLNEAGDEEQMDLIDESGKHYLLRDTRTGKETPFPRLAGFEGAKQMLHDSRTGRRFLWENGLRIAFFELHLNSTDGTTVYALDFDRLRLVRLSPNWATPIPLPGEPAFLTLAENRYVPIPGSEMTANCSYVERWNRSLHKIRYARPGTAAICYGASMYRPGKTPRVVDVR